MTMNNTRSRRRQGSTAPAAPHPVVFVLAALVSLAGLVATYAFFINRTTGQFIDESAWVEADVAQNLIGSQSAQWLDALPATSVVIAAVVIVFVTLARRRWKAAGIALGAMAAANLSTQVIKFGLPVRPDLGVQTLQFNSLPSGHSTLAASAAAAVLLVVAPRWRPLAAFLGGTYAVVSGTATLINQWHRPADVLAAFFVVSLWTALAALVILRTGNDWNVWSGPGEHWAASRWWPALAALLAVLAATATGVGLPVLLRHPESSTVSFFLAGVGQIVVCGYALTAAAIVLLNSQARRRWAPVRRRSR